MRIRFVNLDVQSEGSPTAFTEVTGRCMICGAGLCSMQGSVVQRGVKRVVMQCCAYILLYTQLRRARQHKVGGGGREGSVPESV